MLSPAKNQPSHDLVFTPQSLALDIILHFGHREEIVDPARGGGAFYNQFICDRKDWFELREDRSFFDNRQKFQTLMTNPPWSKMREFLRYGYRYSDEVIYLVTMTHLCTKARLREMRTAGFGWKEFYCVPMPRINWPSSGFQLGAAQLIRGYSGPLHITGAVGT